MDWETHKKILLKDPEVKKAIKETRLEYEVARAIIMARIKHKVTQKKLAQKLKTKQSVISRFENAKSTPTLNFLKRLASVFGGSVKVTFEGI